MSLIMRNVYRSELAAIRSSLMPTLNDLQEAFTKAGMHAAAARVDEAQCFIRAAFQSLDSTLTHPMLLGGRKHD